MEEDLLFSPLSSELLPELPVPTMEALDRRRMLRSLRNEGIAARGLAE